MNSFIFRVLIMLCIGVFAPSVNFAAKSPSEKIIYQKLHKPGEKIFLDAEHYFIFGFDKKPKIGKSIIRVDIFMLDGQRDRSFVVKGDADMPSMRGAHSTGFKNFVLSTKGVYLLPVQFVMPGDWEVRFIFEKNGKTVSSGAYLFDI